MDTDDRQMKQYRSSQKLPLKPSRSCYIQFAKIRVSQSLARPFSSGIHKDQILNVLTLLHARNTLKLEFDVHLLIRHQFYDKLEKYWIQNIVCICINVLSRGLLSRCEIRESFLKFSRQFCRGTANSDWPASVIFPIYLFPHVLVSCN